MYGKQITWLTNNYKFTTHLKEKQPHKLMKMQEIAFKRDNCLANLTHIIASKVLRR